MNIGKAVRVSEGGQFHVQVLLESLLKQRYYNSNSKSGSLRHKCGFSEAFVYLRAQTRCECRYHRRDPSNSSLICGVTGSNSTHVGSIFVPRMGCSSELPASGLFPPVYSITYYSQRFKNWQGLLGPLKKPERKAKMKEWISRKHFKGQAESQVQTENYRHEFNEIIRRHWSLLTLSQ